MHAQVYTRCKLISNTENCMFESIENRAMRREPFSPQSWMAAIEAAESRLEEHAKQKKGDKISRRQEMQRASRYRRTR